MNADIVNLAIVNLESVNLEIVNFGVMGANRRREGIDVTSNSRIKD